MRSQLRPFWSDEEIKKIYEKPFEHSKWKAHQERVANTVSRTWFEICNLPLTRPEEIADLAAGDGAIATRLGERFQARVELGDITSRYDIVGPIERTIEQLPHTDLLIMTEILEHVQDPDKLLFDARHRAGMLLISTPLGEFDDRNEEHYWGWDESGIRTMLRGAGWSIATQWNFTPDSDDYYTFQNWIAI